ncbi:MAG: hypothetical protein V9E89_06670 [Ilumatobacteraceae bacterium]
MRIAIIGGGIGGQALALSLHAAGLTDVEIFEASAQLAELGVGINVLPHAMRELTELGVAGDLTEISVPTARLSYFNRFGQQIWSEPRWAGRRVPLAAGQHPPWPAARGAGPAHRGAARA